MPRAKTESKIEFVQIFFACLLTGYTIKFLTGLDEQQKLTLGFACTWMCVDCGLVAFTRVYIQNAMYLKKQGEITKNLYTLYFLQQRISRQNYIRKKLRNNLWVKLKVIMSGIKAKKEAESSKAGSKVKAAGLGMALFSALVKKKPGEETKNVALDRTEDEQAADSYENSSVGDVDNRGGDFRNINNDASSSKRSMSSNKKSTLEIAGNKKRSDRWLRAQQQLDSINNDEDD